MPFLLHIIFLIWVIFPGMKDISILLNRQSQNLVHVKKNNTTGKKAAEEFDKEILEKLNKNEAKATALKKILKQLNSSKPE
jgi:hypothetical protein